MRKETSKFEEENEQDKNDLIYMEIYIREFDPGSG